MRLICLLKMQENLSSVEELFCNILREIPHISQYDSFNEYIESNESKEHESEFHKYNIKEYKKKMEKEIERLNKDDQDIDKIKQFEATIYKSVEKVITNKVEYWRYV